MKRKKETYNELSSRIFIEILLIEIFYIILIIYEVRKDYDFFLFIIFVYLFDISQTCSALRYGCFIFICLAFANISFV